MKIVTTILVLFGLIQISISQTSERLSKKELLHLYDSLYVSSKVESIVWNGNVKNCNPGTVSAEIFKKAQDRINFFRIVSGLPEIKLNKRFNEEAQSSALLIKANNFLTHSPASTVKCYSVSASNGCAKSCIGFTDYINYPKTSFITGFIKDYGSDNYYVGHRRWLLYSKLSEFGYGATDNSESILTVDGINNDSITCPDYITYPWSGFVPVDLIFPKWSFSIDQEKDVDFSKATISMTFGNGKVIKVKKLKEYKNYLDHTLVWNATGLFTPEEIKSGVNKLAENGFLNAIIKITIKNVTVDGTVKNYNYFIIPIETK
jgi:hypothetical protein